MGLGGTVSTEMSDQVIAEASVETGRAPQASRGWTWAAGILMILGIVLSFVPLWSIVGPAMVVLGAILLVREVRPRWLRAWSWDR